MKPVYQTRFGAEGNCWPACLASLFEVPLEEVDQCACQHEDWRAQTDAWLASKGLFYVEVPWVQEGTGLPFPITCPPDGSLVIVGCWSNRNLPHVCICKVNVVKRNEKGQGIAFGVELVHDPHPEGGAFSQVDGIMIFGKLFL